ncbi:helix-turn-helix domain-containing protein [Chitinophaga pinensis]|uniref:Transcriptional regulator, AraC family n=1 Tax=Chitinophaga pinensis (strain ATCC 43595 / DSM 2588 / LMG 13176 / NBRC 15968 / NCIMB 11800 / UQM 2034) TaxID=485918 RepID=A0A979GYE2_CHIPD|nr:helix-turn-helix domain-containing protein [Chitinophaga pinensis]ACU63096.1 transcriptional regulator, AraC family [Chitinophaga pinensis DSM 2588]
MLEKDNSLQLDQTLLYIRNLDSCPPSYLYDPARKDFFEVLWLQDELPLHQVPEDRAVRGHWIYLMPPYRVHQLNKAGKKGILFSFKRELLEEEDKEFALDVFRIFNISGEFTTMLLSPDMIERLNKVYELLEAEYKEDSSNLPMIKSLLKVFLLHLTKMKKEEFTTLDINQKRAYEFLLLLEDHYIHERNIQFYANQLGISPKRLNQVLKEVLNQTGIQLLHDRLILEAKRQIIHSENSIKEVAWLLGFRDRPYFSRFFKVHTGQTPEAFQKHVKKHVDTLLNTLVS